MVQMNWRIRRPDFNICMKLSMQKQSGTQDNGKAFVELFHSVASQRLVVLLSSNSPLSSPPPLIDHLQVRK